MLEGETKLALFFRKLEWLKMKPKFIYDICVLVYKVTNNILPEGLFTFPTINQTRNIHINTRNHNSLYIPRTSTDFGARGLNVGGPKMWNEIPESVRNCQTLSSFKNQLYNSLLAKQFT